MGAKVNFNEITKIITVTLPPDASGEIYIDVKEDLYSDGKEDWVNNENLRKFTFPIGSVGGDNLPGSKALGATFFLASDWKIRPYEASHKFVINGNLYSRDGSDPFLNTLGTYTVRIIQQVSSLVDSTIQQLSEIEYASFGGGVTIDVINGSTGTSYPTGTHQQSSNNFTDAKIIADERGFDVFYVIGDFSPNMTDDINEYTFIGQAPTKSIITIVSGTSTNKTEFYDCHLTGTVDGSIHVENCHIANLYGVGGTTDHTDIIDSVFSGSIVLKNTSTTMIHIIGCLSGTSGPPIPILDINDSISEVVFRSFSGGIRLKNVSQGQDMSFDFVSGQIIFDTTVSNIEAVVRGNVKITDNSTGGHIDITSVLLPQTAFIDGFISIDSSNGESGTVFPIGTPTRPVNNIDDALIVANTQKIRKFYIRGAVTLSQEFTDWTFIGIGSIFNDVVNLNSKTLTGCRFETTTVSGTMVGTNNVFFRCSAKNIIGLDGLFIDTVLQGSLTMGEPGSIVTGQNIAAYGDIPGSPATINIGGAGRIFQASLDGAIYFTTAATGSAIEIGLKNGTIVLDPTCTGGTALFTGVGNLINYSTMTILGSLLNDSSISDAILDETLMEHTISGTIGKAIDDTLTNANLIPAVV